MRKVFLAICSILLISLAAFVPGCEGEPTTGTIEVDATLDGVPWTGAVAYTLTPETGSPVSGTSVDDTFTVDAGNWTCAYVSGGPGVFVSYTPDPPTQEVNAGDTVGFTLNFVTPEEVDAWVEFDSWTINGLRVDPSPIPYVVLPGDYIDVEYKEHVSGEEDAVVTVHQTSWLEVHNIGYEGIEPGPSIWLHVVNAPGAVKMDPPADKSNQQATVDGNPVDPCTEIELKYCVPVKLDVEVDLELVVCNNYTKTINWIGFPSGVQMILLDGPDVLFDATSIANWVSLNLTSWACVEVGEGFEDTNPANDCCDPCPTLTILYNPVGP